MASQHVDPDLERVELLQINSSKDIEHEEHSSGSKKGRGRGPAKLMDLLKIKSTDERIKVNYNDNGQPIGIGKVKLAGYGGHLVKSFVPISYENWHKVPIIIKKKLWSAIQLKFDVDLNTRKRVLSAMSGSWRAFKTLLTRRYVNCLKDKPELLKHPPEKYERFIDPEVWEKFVSQRLTPKFQTLSNDQRKRRFKKKYNHRMSKKGYAGLAEDLKAELKEKFDDDRSFLWLKGHEKKDCENGDDSIQKIAERVLELKRQVNDGSIVIEGSNDILTMALCTPEHSGRVRGKGFGILPSNYFNMPRRGSKRYINALESELRETKKKMKDMEAQFKLQSNSVEEPSSKKAASNVSVVEPSSKKAASNVSVVEPSSEKAASNVSKSDNKKYLSRGTSKNQTHISKVKDGGKTHGKKSSLFEAHIVQVEENNQLQDGLMCKTRELDTYEGKCRLAIDSKTNIVAEGKVLPSILNQKIHNVPLGEHNVRVTILKAISPKALLPVPVGDEMNIVDDAVGSIVAWPKKFVIIGLESKKNGEIVGFNEKQKAKNVGVSEKQSEEKRGSDCALIDAFTHTMEVMNTDSISIPMVKEMFQDENEKCFLIIKKDILDFCELHPLNVTCLVVYMRYLFDKFQSSQEKYIFFNPASLNGATFVKKTRYIGERLRNANRNQICLIPLNLQNMFHWVLVVIDLSTMIVYWLDSQNTGPTEQDKLYITTGLKMASIDKKRYTPTWNVVKCPMQRDLQSGYYVMMFIKYLLEDSTTPIKVKMRMLSDKKYTMNEINDVRVEFIEFISEYVR